jgi:hypothetical protein
MPLAAALVLRDKKPNRRPNARAASQNIAKRGLAARKFKETQDGWLNCTRPGGWQLENERAESIAR